MSIVSSLQESPTPTKLIAPLSITLSESRRSKFAIERHQVSSLNFIAYKSLNLDLRTVIHNW